MKIFPLLVVISSAAHVALSERQVVSINDRTFSIYWPTPNNATHAGDGSCTILLGLHGLGDNADSFCAWTSFKEYAERDGVVLVCPQGLPGWLGEVSQREHQAYQGVHSLTHVPCACLVGAFPSCRRRGMRAAAARSVVWMT